MEDWIGILAVILMVPGLILLLGVVTIAAIHLKRQQDRAGSTILPPVINSTEVAPSQTALRAAIDSTDGR